MTRILAKLFTLIILLGGLLTPISNAVYSDTETSIGNTFTAGCWSPPSVPVLNSPANGYIAGRLSEWNLHPVMDWNDSTFVCPGLTRQYQYESYRNSDLTNRAFQSVWLAQSQIPAGGTAEGVYYWHVRARDSEGRMSDWSPAWQITVDRTSPVTKLDFGGAYIKETIINGEFNGNLNGWSTQGEVNYTTGDGVAMVRPGSTGGMVRVGHTEDDGNEVWENRISQQIPSGTKNLSFYYNFFSSDWAFDDPGIEIRLNDNNVFYLTASDIIDLDDLSDTSSSGWAQVSFDISRITDPVLEIIFYSGNTGDDFDQSWVYIDSVTTAEAVVAGDQPFTLTATDNLSGVAGTFYSFDGDDYSPASSFDLSTIPTSTWVYYYSRDNAGNNENPNLRYLTNDSQAPDDIEDLDVLSVSQHEISLDWTVPEDDPFGIAPSVYDIRYSESPIDSDNFNDATRVPNLPAPRLFDPLGTPQDFTVTGLDTDTLYFFAIRSADAALNWSGISNVVSATTEAETDIDPGDVVINEVMWMGTLISEDDEYLELRNMTDQEIDLFGWSVAGVVIPDDKTIAPQGYFLITNFDKAGSKINVDPDVVDTALVLDDGDLVITLYDAGMNVIDVADNAEGLPAAGQFDAAGNVYYSMERDASPGDGSRADVWHTCFAASADLNSYWDAGFIEKGTPGGKNLSQAGDQASTQLDLFYADHKARFTLINVALFNHLKYQLTYPTISGQEAIIGEIGLSGENSVEVKDLVTGTCSSGGACVYHEGVTELNLQVELTGVINRTLTETLKL